MFDAIKLEVQLKDVIRTELTKRGFHVPFYVKITDDLKHIKIESEKFQTIPVIFKEIRIINFGSSIKDNVENPKFKDFWVTVSVNYKHFDHGENGCSLFSVIGKYNPNNDVMIFEIK